jgi:hypothetical protein
MVPLPQNTVRAYARRLNRLMGKPRARSLDKLIFSVAGELGLAVQKKWKIKWSAADGTAFPIKTAKQLPPEVLIWTLGILCCGWGADIYLRKARDRRSLKMERLYHQWRRLLIEGLCEIEREVQSTSGNTKHKEWLAWTRRAKTDPRFNPKTNRFDKKLKKK